MLVVGATMVGLGSAPRAQVPGANAARNAKQRLLAGEPLPVNMTALHDMARQRPKPVFAPGRVVMKLADGMTDEVATTLARHAGAYGISRPRSADFVIVSLPLDADVVAAAAALAAQPGVVYAQPDPIAVLAYVPNDPLYQYQWNFHRLSMERTWDINRGATPRWSCRSRLRARLPRSKAPSRQRRTWRAPRSSPRTTSSGR
jgi:hypothetical protein